MWKITKYHCDENGSPYGEPFTTVCYTQELMESYRKAHFVQKIVEVLGKGQEKVVWER
jgi:hypothetical protein